MSQIKRALNLHNPGSLTEEELISSFVIREKEFKNIFNDIKSSSWEEPEQHYIIQGQRGSGKTTLLYRIYYEVKNNKKLSKGVIPIMFNEEQYHIRKLYKLWESLCEHLEYEQDFDGLTEEFEESFDHKDFETLAFEIIAKALKKEKKKLVLFLDNIGDMLNKFSDQEISQMREILLTSPDIRIIGASSVILEHTYDYSKPFFDFFKFVYLNELNKEEGNRLLLHLGEIFERPEIKRIIEEQPERIETLRRLTGGVARTMVLLFEIFVDDESGESFKDLETALDRVTPLYKHRMDDLSAQQAEIIDAIAISWDAVTTKEIAKKTRMESKFISAQLTQLEKNRVIEKIEQTGTKNHLYAIKERFFNIWYLMRCGRSRDKARVKWLVRFLQVWCSEEELVERAKRHIAALEKGNHYPKHAYFLSEALAQAELPPLVQHDLINKTREFLNQSDQKLSNQLSRSDRELYDEATEYYSANNYSKCLKSLEQIINKDGFVLFHFGLLYNIGFKDFDKAKEYYVMAWKKGYVRALNNLALLLENEFKDFEKAKEYYLIAVDNNDAGAINNLANLYYNIEKDYEKAKKYYLMAIDKANKEALKNLADLYLDIDKDYEKAKKYYLMAVDKGDTGAMNNLALLYENEIKDLKRAEKYYLMAIDKGSSNAMNNLAFLYRDEYKDLKKAEKYYLMAVHKGNVSAMDNLAHLYITEYEDVKNAEKYYLMAVKEGFANSMYNLGLLYKYEHKDCGKAQKYLRMAVEKEHLGAMNSLAWIYYEQKTNKREAVDLAEKACQKEEDLHLLHTLATVLIWDNQIEVALTHVKNLIKNKVAIDEIPQDMANLFMLLIAKKQYHSTLKLFEDETLNLKELFKPLYYALIYFMQDEYPNEYKKVGSEIKETVEEIIDEINQMAIDYV